MAFTPLPYALPPPGGGHRSASPGPAPDRHLASAWSWRPPSLASGVTAPVADAGGWGTPLPPVPPAPPTFFGGGGGCGNAFASSVSNGHGSGLMGGFDEEDDLPPLLRMSADEFLEHVKKGLPPPAKKAPQSVVQPPRSGSFSSAGLAAPWEAQPPLSPMYGSAPSPLAAMGRSPNMGSQPPNGSFGVTRTVVVRGMSPGPGMSRGIRTSSPMRSHGSYSPMPLAPAPMIGGGFFGGGGAAADGASPAAASSFGASSPAAASNGYLPWSAIEGHSGLHNYAKQAPVGHQFAVPRGSISPTTGGIFLALATGSAAVAPGTASAVSSSHSGSATVQSSTPSSSSASAAGGVSYGSGGGEAAAMLVNQILGSWQYAETSQYTISRTPQGTIRFDETHKSGRAVRGVMHVQGDWLQGELRFVDIDEAAGVMRLRPQNARQVVSNFRGPGELEWGDVLPAYRLEVTVARPPMRQIPSGTMPIRSVSPIHIRSTSPMRWSPAAASCWAESAAPRAAAVQNTGSVRIPSPQPAARALVPGSAASSTASSVSFGMRTQVQRSHSPLPQTSSVRLASASPQWGGCPASGHAAVLSGSARAASPRRPQLSGPAEWEVRALQAEAAAQAARAAANAAASAALAAEQVARRARSEAGGTSVGIRSASFQSARPPPPP
eukprot:CAMPEP_0183596108 /NCGR_PEP_ID=MMETSP0371-20130417/174558_1 /TAXON_ID=268820 /ORGANISM="Peridinium aciculiferum, Strain PAER-2" /LENGTH=664 /DNA_ID=CAMNT_0025807963 /DNA_START=60 /DNA_END=2050 /DNA_ORIENTATION=-